MAVTVKNRNLVAIERMGAIVAQNIQRAPDEMIKRELEGLLKGVKAATPSNLNEVKKIDRDILAKLNLTTKMFEEGVPVDKILALTTEIGLNLLERKQKLEKNGKL